MKRNVILSLAVLFVGALTMANDLSSPSLNETETITVHFSGEEAERLYNHLNVRELGGVSIPTQSTRIKRAENVTCSKVTDYGDHARVPNPRPIIVTFHCEVAFDRFGIAGLTSPLLNEPSSK